MSKRQQVNTVVIGAGQAGLAMSRWLKRHDLSHTVLERRRVGDTWRSQRWDSFYLNTPNSINMLPGDAYEGGDPDGFVSHQALLTYFEDYRRRHRLPVEEGVEVTALRTVEDGFEVEAAGAVRACQNVVLCTGDQNCPSIPRVAERLPKGVTQLHIVEYRRPAQLPAGGVLVVGSGQSGVQVVEDLLAAGRTVHLSTSAVGRAPRRYRGRDILEWMRIAGLGEQRPEDLEDPREVQARQPQISGTHGGHTVSLQLLAHHGARLLGRLSGGRGRGVSFDGDLEANVARGDQVSARFKGMVDMVISKRGIDAPPAEPDPADRPFPRMTEMAAVRELDLDAAGIRTVVWATGFRPRFDYLSPELRDESGRPRHRGGVCDVPGLYCLGLTWLRRRFSGLVGGVSADAEYIAGHIAERRAFRTQP